MTDAYELPMFPLSAVVFPHAQLALNVFEPRYQQLLCDVQHHTRRFGITLIAKGSEVGGGDERVNIGTLVEIEYCTTSGDGRSTLIVRAMERLEVREWLEDAPYPRAMVRSMPQQPFTGAPDELVQALAEVRRARALLSEASEVPALCHAGDDGWTPDSASWILCALAPISLYDAQQLLEVDDPSVRLAHLRRHCREVAELAVGLLEAGDEPTLT